MAASRSADVSAPIPTPNRIFILAESTRSPIRWQRRVWFWQAAGSGRTGLPYGREESTVQGSVSVTMNAPAQKVWELVSDVRNTGRFSRR